MPDDSPTRLKGKEAASLSLSRGEFHATSRPFAPRVTCVNLRLPLLPLLCAISGGNHANEGKEEKKGYKRGIRFVNGKRSISFSSTGFKCFECNLQNMHFVFITRMRCYKQSRNINVQDSYT